jgi:branched-chain amino acid transport system permease protein
MSQKLTAAVALLVALGLALVAAPSLDPATRDLGTTLLVYLTIAQAWNILAGFAGQISLGASTFVATGSYTAGLVLIHASMNWLLGVALAAVASAALAALLAVPLLRLRGDYFAIGALAASIAAQALLTNWAWAGGAAGITLPIDRIPSGAELFALAAVVAGLAMAVALYIRNSAFGLRLAAVRDNEAAAAGLGVAVYWHRFAAFLASSVLTGMAGTVVAYQYVAVSPAGVANVNWSLNAVLMTLVGGMGSLLGPPLGVVVVYYGLTRQLEGFQVLSLLVEGVLLVLIVKFAPAGVWALLTRAARAGWQRRPRRVPQPQTPLIPSDLA